MAAPFPSPVQTWHDNTYDSLSYTRPELSAKGKTVVVTGGGTGIGAETARQFAAAGVSKIVLLGRREKPLQETKAAIESKYPGVEVVFASTDVTNRSQVDASFKQLIGTGKIHVLISNAASSQAQVPFAEINPDVFIDDINGNLKGTTYVAQAFLRSAAPDAVVVDVNSMAAIVNFNSAFTAYSVMKSTVYRLWDYIGFAHPQMSVFHIQPGVVDTDMNKQAGGVAAMGFSDDVSLPGSFNLWLASPEARFLRNKFLFVNWDVEELKADAKEIESGTKFNYGMVGWPFGSQVEAPKGEWKHESDAK